MNPISFNLGYVIQVFELNILGITVHLSLGDLLTLNINFFYTVTH